MNINKISQWLGGLTLVFTGSLLLYFETYRNNQFIDTLYYFLLLFGWVLIFIQATKGTSIDAKKIFFNDDKAGWFKQRTSNLIFYLILGAMIFGNWYYISNLAHDRKQKILTDQPTKTAIALVGYIDIRHGRSSTSYYAVFQFTVDGKLISHPWYEANEDEFKTGDKYLVKYSVEYPEMFVLERKLP